MVALIGAVLGQTGDGWDSGWDHMGGWGGGWMWLWGLAMMSMFVVLIVWLVRATSGGPYAPHRPEQSSTERAQEILAERYARGELSTEEYRERATELQ
ncbi:MAG: SHOCT domain-containing protein [Acidimicrobiia bacterium]|nr:SHOCT domain-containing protein [Acidimicrobiia bacterium]